MPAFPCPPLVTKSESELFLDSCQNIKLGVLVLNMALLSAVLQMVTPTSLLCTILLLILSYQRASI